MFIKTIFTLLNIQLLATILNIAFGLMLAYYFGTSSAMDAFWAASMFVIEINALFLKAQSKSFIPFIAGFHESAQRSKVVSMIVSFNFYCYGLLSILVFFGADIIASLIAPGFTPEQQLITTRILKILSINVLFANLCGLGAAILEYDLHFSRSKLIGLITSIIPIITLITCVKLYGIYSIPIARVLSLLVGLVFFVFIIFRSSVKIKLCSIFTPEIKAYLFLMFPVILSAFFMAMIKFTDSIMASFMGTGSLSKLSYCLKIVLHLSLLQSSISLIYFTVLSKLNKPEDDQEHLKVFNHGLHITFCVSLFITIFTVIFSLPLVKLLYQQKSFTLEDSLVVSELLKYCFFLILCSPLGAYLSNVYFTRKKVKYPIIYSLISSITNIILNIVLGILWGLTGLAVASSLAFLLGNILQISNVRKANKEFRLPATLKNNCSMLYVGIISGISMYLVNHNLLERFQSVIALLVYLGINFIAYSLLYLGLGKLFGVQFINELLMKAKQKLFSSR